MSDLWWINCTAPILHLCRVWPSSWYLMFSCHPKNSCIILYLQLTDLRSDVPHQVLVQEIQAVWTEQLRQGPQLCSEGNMNYWDHGGEEQRLTDVDKWLNVHYKLHKCAHTEVKPPAETVATDSWLWLNQKEKNNESDESLHPAQYLYQNMDGEGHVWLKLEVVNGLQVSHHKAGRCLTIE